MYKNFIKPFFDFLIAVFLLIILSPIIIITAILLFFTNHGLVLFMQQRPGLNCKPFNIIKFKTMRDSFFKNGQPLPDDERLTKIGKLIRSTSIDELLQLINVIKGEMSLIGPRPLMMQYISRYNCHQIKRQNVKPGITGWAQVNGRNSIKWDEKFFLMLNM
jgi:lipopolysaccharide/colanic/teichoic acid biosynthesis glycosyltransferase